jgi:4-oxalocrotonate tautomerase
MPRVIVKVCPGKSERQKVQLADAIAKDLTNALNFGEESVSVVIKETKSPDPGRNGHKPELITNPAKSVRSRSGKRRWGLGCRRELSGGAVPTAAWPRPEPKRRMNAFKLLFGRRAPEFQATLSRKKPEYTM